MHVDGQWTRALPRYGYAAFTDNASPNKSLIVVFVGNLFLSWSKTFSMFQRDLYSQAIMSEGKWKAVVINSYTVSHTESR